MIRMFPWLFLVLPLAAPAKAEHSVDTASMCRNQRTLVHEFWQRNLYATSPEVSKIMLAAFEGDTASMRRGLAALPETERARWRQTALATAVAGDQPATVHALIADGADPNARDWVPPLDPQAFGKVAGSLARDKRFGGTKGVDALRKAGALDNNGTFLPPPLFEVMLCNQVDVARMLLEGGASVHVTESLHDHRQSSDPLVPAAIYGDTGILRLMLAHGANTCHDDHRMAAVANTSNHAPAPTVASLAKKHGVPDSVVAQLVCPVP